MNLLLWFLFLGAASADSVRSKRSFLANTKNWVGGNVFYYFDETDFLKDAPIRKLVAYAMNLIKSQTCVKFIESSTAPNRIRIYNGSQCLSSTGMIGGEQTLSLAAWCRDDWYTVTHEMIHALGFVHTQSRSDRDNYITIETDNIKRGWLNQFELLQPNEDIITTPYDYYSIMHYPTRQPSTAIDWKKPVMTPKDSRYFYEIGMSNMTTFYDFKMINDRYCNETCPASTSAKCKNGGYPHPRDCTKCHCPLGYGGRFCDERPSGCGATLNATSDWQSVSIKVGEDGNPNEKDFTYCYHWITAPQDKKVEVYIKEMEGMNLMCEGCVGNGVEVKVQKDPRITNLRYCCLEKLQNKTLVSELNPTPVITYNQFGWFTGVTLLYRYIPSENSGTTSTSAAPTTSTTTTSTTTTKPTTTSTATTTTRTPKPTTTSTTTSTTTTTTSRPTSTTTTTTSPSTTTTVTTTTTPKPTTTTTSTTTTITSPITSTSTSTTTSTTTKLTTTTMTSPKPPVTNCVNAITDDNCQFLKDTVGFCNIPLHFTFRQVKYACGKTCEMCGKAAAPCVDNDPKCALYKEEGKCSTWKPMEAEWLCPLSCGFCEKPN